MLNRRLPATSTQPYSLTPRSSGPSRFTSATSSALRLFCPLSSTTSSSTPFPPTPPSSPPPSPTSAPPGSVTLPACRSLTASSITRVSSLVRPTEWLTSFGLSPGGRLHWHSNLGSPTSSPSIYTRPARIGKGILFDHATGVVVGETAVIGNNVSILHHVTLGGTGKVGGDRHPKIGDGVLIGAGATILGNVKIGVGAKIGAGSVVLIDVPPRTTAVGNPARLVGGKERPSKNEEVPGESMDHTSFISDWRPVVGRKRCKEHEGKRVGKSTSKLFAAGDIPSLFDGSGNSACKNQKYNDTPSPSVSDRNVDISSICGATLTNGSFCRRQPVEGRKRCWEHKGMWANSLLARGMMVNGTMSTVVEAKSGLFDTSSKISSCNDWKYNYTSSRSVSHKSVVNEDFSSTCGATLNDGSFCRRQPAEGRKRCWQHKGMRASSSLSYSSISMYDSEGISSHICGAGLRNGSICNRMPVLGRKRCEQHKGMRAA
ncbi:hypothetical protein F0562_029919 [Nyssa sinensis]|uniref:serine O-acetyltransferase n=1 Tax=Nyssa sinensis TaxID=561372 RepID=A0A5J5AUP6_9ASTE|nr:hypothetical protein F0562_029919 [Nyssa sinensis]